MNDRIDELVDALHWAAATCAADHNSNTDLRIPPTDSDRVATRSRMRDALTELATIARDRDLWRRRAVTLATVIGDFTEPLHFATVGGVRTATVRALASVMFSLDDGTLFKYPEGALEAASEAVGG